MLDFNNARSLMDVIRDYYAEHKNRPAFTLAQLYYGDGYPGIKTVRALEESGLPYTGADAAFYELTTPKTLLKERLLRHGVSTSPFVTIKDPQVDVPRAGALLSYPLIIKPDVSAASFGISIKSVVHDEVAGIPQAQNAIASERDPENYYEGVFAERFIPGREFTVLCTA